MPNRSNLQIDLAQAAARSVSAMNAHSAKNLEIHNKMLDSEEENKQASNTQKRQIIPHALAATTTLATTFALSYLSQASYKKSVIEIVGKLASDSTQGINQLQQGKVTYHSHNSQIAQSAMQRITSIMESAISLISRTVENIGRLNAKEI
jgi:hypothetical protein